MPKKRGPVGLAIWTYRIGFGDCFLLQFEYAGGDKRNVLIDFGTTAKPKGAPAKLPLLIAQDIAKKCTGENGKAKLHAVVATHRHKDHISGFATAKGGKGPGDVIAGLAPDVVVQPWTEHPRARPNARSAPGAGITKSMRQSVASLENMHEVAGASLALARRMRKAIDFQVASEIEFLGDDNLKNESAVRNLAAMGSRKGARASFVSFGKKSGLERTLPGVKVHVLGPPTLEQTQTIEDQRERDPVEFWHFWGTQARASAAVNGGARKLFPRAHVEKNPAWARWFRKRLSDVTADSTLQLVRILDEAMNNTSVILLFEVGTKRLLFPGDAQIENWAYALGKKSVQRLLAGVDVYKVGHHGSLNATPKKSLWELFNKRSKKVKNGRLVTLMSTQPGKHGSVKACTEVPRGKLVDALKAETTLLDSTKFKLDAGEYAELHAIAFRRGWKAMTPR